MQPLDWQTSADALAMLDALFPQRGVDSTEPQPRQCRLYLLACARRAWADLPGVCRVVAGLAERVYAGRQPDRRLRDQVYQVAENLVLCRGEAEDVNAIGRQLVLLGHASTADVWAGADVPADRWVGCAHLAFFPFCKFTPSFRRVPAELHSADLLREVFGDPFARRPALDRAWLTDNVLRLARHADTTAEFDGVLPILADALEDAGCDRRDVLAHLRQKDPHVRGCWALELILNPQIP